MINSNKKWLLTASPWMKNSFWLSPLAVSGILLTALLVFNSRVSLAQINATGAINVQAKNVGVVHTDELPAIAGTNTLCWGVGPTTTTLSDATPGGIWSSSNPAVGTIGSTGSPVTFTALAPGVTNIYYTIGTHVAITTITVTYPITGGLSPVCIGNIATLTDTTATGIWTSSNTAVATITVTGQISGISAGTTTISFGRTGACVETIVVTVNPNTIGSITGSVIPIGVCVGGTTTLNDTSAGGTWSSGTTAVATIGSVTGIAVGVSAGGSIITFTKTSTGCYKTAPFIVTSPSSIHGINGTLSVCSGDITSLSDSTSLGVWSSSSTSTATVNAAGGVTGVTTGTSIITFSKSGCAVSAVVTVNPNTITSISPGTMLCVGGITTLTATPAGGAWSSFNTAIGTIGSATGIAGGVATGTTTITYTNAGCYKTTALTVNTIVIPAITGSTVCLAGTAILTDATPGGTWSSATPATATINAYGVLTGVATGTDVITYTLLGCSVTKTITVNPLPGAITGTQTACMGNVTSLTDATTGGTWSSGNTTVATVDGSGNVTGVGMGTTMITYNNGCYVTAVVTVNLLAPITGGNVACIGSSGSYLELHDAITGGTWVSSNTIAATVGATGTVTALTPGTTTISYTTAPGCVTTQVVTVNPRPVAITGTLLACVGSTTTLADTSGGGTGVWSSSNTAAGTIGSATGVVTAISAGNTIISYTVAGCSATSNVNFANVPAPITGPTAVCTGLAIISLTDATAGGTWSVNNTFLHVDTSGSVTGVSAGTTTVSYTVSGCAATTIVTVIANPVSAVAGATYVCSGQTTTLFDATAGGVWTSSNNAIGSVGSTTGVVTGIAAGPLVFTYTIPGGCFKTQVFAVDTMPLAINGAFSVCVNDAITLSDTYTGGGWSTSNNSIATVTSGGVVSGLTVGGVTITYAKGVCAVYQPVSVGANPLSAVGGTASVCTGLTTTLTATPAGGTWTSGNISLATVGTNGAVSGLSVGLPVITYTNSTGCYAIATVTVNATYPAAITGAGSVCQADTIQLSDVTYGGSWKASSTVASVSSGIITGSSTTSGTVTISYTYLGCPATVIITVNPNTIVLSSSATPLCANGTMTLTGTPSGGTWSSGNIAQATVNSATGAVTGVSAGFPIITYYAGGCFREDTVNISASPSAITGNTLVCKGIVDTLYEATGGGTWIASNANATVALGDVLDGYVTGAAPGLDTVTYTVTSTGCSATYVVSVQPTVAAIVAAAGGKVCMGSTLLLSDATAGGLWTSSDITLATIGSTGSPTTLTPVAVGSPVVTYLMPATGCYVTSSISIGTTPGPILGSTTLCTNNSIIVSDGTIGGSWSVTTGSANVAISTWSAPYELVFGVAAGTAVLTYTESGCVVQTYTVTIGASPAPITGDFSACIDTVTTLADTSAGGIWSTSNALISTIGSTGVVTPVAVGMDTIIYTVANGCAATQAFDVSACGHRWGNPGGSNGTVAEQKYSLFPNPSSGNVTIQQSVADDKQMSVTVVNYAGVSVQTGTIQFSGGKGELNILNASVGMYLVMLRDGRGELQTFKVVIEK